MADIVESTRAKPKTTWLGVMMGGFAAFGGFLYGYDTGYIAGCKEMAYFLTIFGEQQADGRYVLSSQTDSLITSILSAGTFFGALLGYPVGDFLGRRYGVLVFLCLFCIGVALQTAVNGSTSNPLVQFVLGRVFAGLGVGGTSCLVPMLQSELAPKHLRGAIVSAYQWMITIGLLIAAVVVNGTEHIFGPASYQIPIGIQFIWAFILGGGLLLLPESPRYLVLKGKIEQAQRSVSKITGFAEGSHELMLETHDIQASIEHELAQSHGASYLDCFRGGESKVALRVLTGIGIQAFQQLSGINFIFYYGTQFFERTGIDGFTTTIITDVVNVVMTIPGLLLVDRLGRRNMLLFGAAAMGTFQIIVSIIGSTEGINPGATANALVALVCLFIGTFAATWGILAWVVTSEIYPTTVRGKAMSLSTASNWLFNFAIGYATPYLVDAVNTNVFYIWGGFCLLAFVFTFFTVRETRQLSLEQVDLLYRKSSLRDAKQWRQKIIDEDLHDMGAYVDENEAQEKATIQHKDVAA